MSSLAVQPARHAASFGGNYQELAALMQSSWAENAEQPLLYTPGFLRSAFSYPGVDPALSPVLLRDRQMAAFLAAFPRTVAFGGKKLHVLVNTFLTVHPAYKKAGFGPMMWREMVQRGRAAGYDGTFSFCVEGDAMNRMILSLSQLLREQTHCVFNVSYMARALRPGSASPGPTEGCDAAAVLLEASCRASLANYVTRVWSYQEAVWQCRDREGAITSVLRSGERQGIITGYLMDAAAEPPVKCVLMDDLLWGDLEDRERQELLDRFLGRAQERGAQLAIVPVLGYADLSPLIGARFRKTRRNLKAYYTSWTNDGPKEALQALYIDVF